MSRSTALPYPPPPGVAPPDAAQTPLEPSAPVPVTVTAQLLADESGATLERAERVLPAAVRAVDDYAPAAPVEMRDQAVIRFAAYLLASDHGTVRTETVGPLSLEYQMNHASAFRNSGAAMLLTRHKVRRAGSVG